MTTSAAGLDDPSTYVGKSSVAPFALPQGLDQQRAPSSWTAAIAARAKNTVQGSAVRVLTSRHPGGRAAS